MPDDKDKPTVPEPSRERKQEERGDKGAFSDHERKGYQTPQDQDDHWNGPDRDKDK